jgi:small subunit ribosomal protein S19e
VHKNHACKAGGSGIRKSLQQLETAGLVQITKPQGRIVTPKGRKLMQEVASDLSKELYKSVPELKKYQGE